jgi:hypothetical protein
MSKLLSIAFLGLSLVGASAQAGEYAAVTLQNPTYNTLSYQVRLDGDLWETVYLPPGCEMTHFWIPDGRGLTVRFDWICGDGIVTDRYYTLIPNYTYWPEVGGRLYVFRYSYDGRFLDLHAR